MSTEPSRRSAALEILHALDDVRGIRARAERAALHRQWDVCAKELSALRRACARVSVALQTLGSEGAAT